METHPYIAYTQGFGEVTVTVETSMLLSSFVETTYNALSGDVLPFIKSLEAYSEDWDLCENLAMHFTEQVIYLLSGGHGDDDPKWKEDFTSFLKEQINKLEGEASE